MVNKLGSIFFWNKISLFTYEIKKYKFRSARVDFFVLMDGLLEKLLMESIFADVVTNKPYFI
jgi:hypothetical protein